MTDPDKNHIQPSVQRLRYVLSLSLALGLAGALIGEFTAITGGVSIIAQPFSAIRNDSAVTLGLLGVLIGILCADATWNLVYRDRRRGTGVATFCLAILIVTVAAFLAYWTFGRNSAERAFAGASASGAMQPSEMPERPSSPDLELSRIQRRESGRSSYGWRLTSTSSLPVTITDVLFNGEYRPSFAEAYPTFLAMDNGQSLPKKLTSGEQALFLETGAFAGAYGYQKAVLFVDISTEQDTWRYKPQSGWTRIAQGRPATRAATILTQDEPPGIQPTQSVAPTASVPSTRGDPQRGDPTPVDGPSPSIQQLAPSVETATPVGGRTPSPTAGPMLLAPDSDGWIPIFRSSDPSIWNSDVFSSRNHFSVPLSRVPSDIRFLRLSPNDRQFVVIPVTKDTLNKDAATSDAAHQYGWLGSNQYGAKAHFLFIYNRAWPLKTSGDIGADFRGWGFAHRYYLGDRQGYAWAGKPIGPTVFEIAVKSSPLTAKEAIFLLQGNAGNGREK